MKRPEKCHILKLAALCSALVAVPAMADVRDGVEAWSRGDYAAAVSEWEGPAAAGDADAMFNLAQAYRVGRGVPLDLQRAEQLFYRASQAGHIEAGDLYGLMLFQGGRQQEALPYIADAARRGDPRSQYLMGIAHFNGDYAERDWVRAYALMTLANGSGLRQAIPALAQMDEFIPLEQRQQGAGMAEQLRAEADSARAVELAAADLGAQIPSASSSAGPAPQPSARVPRPIATTAVSPSVAAARSALEEASRATGTETPAQAGAAYGAPAPESRPRRVAGATVASAPAPASTPAPAPAQVPVSAPRQATASGPWRVQLGAFSVASNAERLWNQIRSRRELAGHQRLLVPAGRVTKLQAGGFASRADAEAACRSLQNSGQDCLVTRQ